MNEFDAKCSTNITDVSIAPPDVAALRTTIERRTADVCTRHYKDMLRAVVLTGSVARDEGTWVRDGSSWRLLGDVEMFIVFQKRGVMPHQTVVDAAAQEIQEVLRLDGIVGRIQLAPVCARYFSDLPPSVFADELRSCGRVVWGDPAILALLATSSSTDIPLEDGWRLLANRVTELLEATAELKLFTKELPEHLRYRTVKLFLDMATSLLVFAGSYAPTYTQRQRELERLSDNESWPFPLAKFAEQVRIATNLKLTGAWERAPVVGWDFLRDGIRYAQLLWCWELERLNTGCKTMSNLGVTRGAIGNEPLARQLRGWLVVWRNCGWLRSWPYWLHWVSLALRGSPRYWVYSAAHRLLCHFSAVLESGDERLATETACDDILRRLPAVQRDTGNQPTAWDHLVSEVAWNYHRFLEVTTA